jgi:transposase-like protein
MAVSDSVDPGTWFAEQIGACEPDLLRQMVKTMAEALMSAEADAVCGAEYGERSGERVKRRNGYRERDWDTRAGTVELAIPKLRSGSYFPEWLLERRRRAEQRRLLRGWYQSAARLAVSCLRHQPALVDNRCMRAL